MRAVQLMPDKSDGCEHITTGEKMYTHKNFYTANESQGSFIDVHIQMRRVITRLDHENRPLLITCVQTSKTRLKYTIGTKYSTIFCSSVLAHRITMRAVQLMR